MSRPYDGRVMDQTPTMAGSVKRARERAQAGLPFDFGLKDSNRSPRRQDEAGSSPSPRTNRPQAPAGWQPTKDGQSPLPISRPQPVPQWPLGGPIASPVYSDAEPYRPPPGQPTEPPPRPQRPSKVPSMLDASRIQEHTPVFQYNPSSPSTRESESFSNLETPVTASSSRPSTLSSVGTIPEFPVPSHLSQDVPQDGLRPAPPPMPQNMPPPPPPNALPMVAPPRRGVVLGPPPSSRRGASSFYSTDPFVSPIPEESPRTRSYASYASSGAIPEEYPLPLPTDSPTFSPNNYSPTHDHYNSVLDDAIDEDPHHEDDGDKLHLVRSASLGKRAKPKVVDNKPNLERSGSQNRPSPQAVQQDPFEEGTAYVDSSSSSVDRDAVDSKAAPVGEALTADTVLKAFHKASATGPSTSNDAPPSPIPYNKMSAVRRPPRLNINAVRDAEARGSLTSLPDLIRRATKLATIMDRGQRPGSRFGDLEFPESAYFAGQRDTVYTMDPEKRQSGFSDMLAAFPPPAQSRLSTRNSGAWLSPLPKGLSKSARSGAWPMYSTDPAAEGDEQQRKPGRRCCGLPMWGFIVLLFIIIAIIVAAVVVPLELLVLNKNDKTAIEKCEAQLNCANGGTNVITQGVCSCICTNGFSGRDCTTPSSRGCTTTSFPSPGSTKLQDVTMGMALPQILQDAEADFSIPLSATTVLSKFNSADLSCNIQNALVTFDGDSSSDLGLTQAGEAIGQQGAVAPIEVGGGASVTEETPVTVTISPGFEIIIGVTDPSQLSVTTIVDTYPTMTMPPPAQTTDTTMQPTSAGDSYPTMAPPAQTTTSTTSQPTETTESSTTTRPTTTSTTKTSQTSSTQSTTASATLSTRAPVPTGDFVVSERAVNFARVAVLFVLQEENLANAAEAQSSLQKFFNNAQPSLGAGVSKKDAQKLAIGQDNSVDLINFSINLGAGQVGGSG